MEGQPLPKEKSLWNLSACIFVPLWYLKRLFLSSLACLDLMKHREKLYAGVLIHQKRLICMKASSLLWMCSGNSPLKKKKKNSHLYLLLKRPLKFKCVRWLKCLIFNLNRRWLWNMLNSLFLLKWKKISQVALSFISISYLNAI